MIPMIEREIQNHGWLSASEFFDVIAIAEMTPGPIAVNSATFVGYKAAGFFGGLSATIGVSMPSLLLILIVSRYFFRFQKHPLNSMIFYGIRPVIAGLIATAAVFIAETAIFNGKLSVEFLSKLLRNPMDGINIWSVVIFIISLIGFNRFKLHPIIVIIVSGLLGTLFFYVI